jgi:hypothetical protein
MSFNARYVDTVRLLLDILPTVFASGRFAMKGGTAINLFVQDMPRLSVDIDLVWLDPTANREADLAAIAADLARLSRKLLEELPGQLTARHRSFLTSLVMAEPDWTLMPFAHLRELPAIRWKLENLMVLRRRHPEKFNEQHRRLMSRLQP